MKHTLKKARNVFLAALMGVSLAFAAATIADKEIPKVQITNLKPAIQAKKVVVKRKLTAKMPTLKSIVKKLKVTTVKIAKELPSSLTFEVQKTLIGPLPQVLPRELHKSQKLILPTFKGPSSRPSSRPSK